MLEPDVALTDYGLAAECGVFAGLLAMSPTSWTLLRSGAACYFGFLGLSAATGGTVHGFCPSKDAFACQVLWVATLQLIGLSAASLWTAAAALLNRDRGARHWWAWAAVPLFVVYSVAAILITQKFWIAFTIYAPALLLSLVAFTVVTASDRYLLIGAAGVVTSVTSCLVQFLKFGLHPIYLSHNAVAHVIQGVALGLLFMGFRRCIARPPRVGV